MGSAGAVLARAQTLWRGLNRRAPWKCWRMDGRRRRVSRFRAARRRNPPARRPRRRHPVPRVSRLRRPGVVRRGHRSRASRTLLRVPCRGRPGSSARPRSNGALGTVLAWRWRRYHRRRCADRQAQTATATSWTDRIDSAPPRCTHHSTVRRSCACPCPLSPIAAFLHLDSIRDAAIPLPHQVAALIAVVRHSARRGTHGRGCGQSYPLPTVLRIGPGLLRGGRCHRSSG